MKIGTSYVSMENAALNLQTENPGWDFAAVKAAAEDSWRKRLGAIEIEGGTEAQKTMFYTHLYQSFFHPNIFSDVNGEYMGFDNQVHSAQGYTHYANYSGWDIYRTWIQLVAVLFPKDTSDMMQSLVEDSKQAGGGLPIWPVANRETGTMAGGSTTPLIANAYAFGARGFDTDAAYQAMDRDESDPSARCQGFTERPYLVEYLKLGYVSWDHNTYPGRVSASQVLDYNQGEYALSRFAAALGHADRSAFYEKMSENWKNLFNSDSGYIQPREYDGSWYATFDPDFGSLDNHTKEGFDEGTASTWTWQVPHDLPTLIQMMGGPEKAIARLDDHFTRLNDGTTFLPFPQMGKYSWIGNEPEFNTPWVYNWAGAPWKTQALVRRELLEEFIWHYPGDEDLGAMSAWAVWASLGLYPSIPGVGGFTVGSPLFPRATVHLGNGHTLVIAAPGSSESTPYIQALSLNGAALSRTWVDFNDLSSTDSELDFSLGTEQLGWSPPF
jgi:predicted alpha-1,2-mannosidase